MTESQQALEHFPSHLARKVLYFIVLAIINSNRVMPPDRKML